MAGRLICFVPVASGTVARTFSFEITPADLIVLRDEPASMSALQAAARAALLVSLDRRNPEVTAEAFRAITDRILHP